MVFDDETQIMELSGETDVIDDDGGDFGDQMDTQLLEVSDDNEGSECTSGRKCIEKAETSAVGSIDVELQDRSGNQTAGFVEKETSNCRREDGGDRSESILSGSAKRGSASVCITTLRAAGLATRQKNVDNGSAEIHCFDDRGISSNVERASGEKDMEISEEEGSRGGEKSSVVRSLARKLFGEEDVTDPESDHNIGDSGSGREDDVCNNDVAGLNYVDSQEPGELSQANALEFVDRFLKVNVFESDESIIRKNAVAEKKSPGAIAKGAQSVAQQARRKSILAEASIYEWDDNLEEEGGGEFFIKKKDMLYGTPKSCPKPQSSRHRETRENKSLGKLRNEKKKQNLHNSVTGLLNSDLKTVNGRENGKGREIHTEKKVYNCSGQELGLGSCSKDESAGVQEASAVVHDPQSADINNVGVDTQMAAEAMEALAAVTELVNCNNIADLGCHSKEGQTQKEVMKNDPSKQCSLQKRAWFSTSGVVTRSRSKRTIMTCGRSTMGKFDVDLVNSMVKQNRSSMKFFSTVDRESCDGGAVSVGGKQPKSNFEGQLINNPPQPLKRRSLRGRASTFTPVVQQAAQSLMHHHKKRKTTNNMVSENMDDALGDSGERHCLDLVYEKKRKTRSNTVSEILNNRNDSASANSNKVDGLNCRTGHIQRASNEDQQCGDKRYTFSADRGPEFTLGSIARQTRSRSRSSTTQRAGSTLDEIGLFSSGMLSSLNTHQFSSKNQDASSPLAKGTLTSATIDGSPGNMPKSSIPTYRTPVNLKTPRTSVSPICMGDGYHTPSFKNSLSLKKEVSGLIASEQRTSSPFKGLRQRRDMHNVRVLFSQHLDDNIIKQQKKILSRFGVSVGSLISEATHFVADRFVRTRNMLEAIAYAKPVVTPLWLESCGQANCFIDEKNYILRDAKKEKELGFNLPSNYLQGKRVLITPNAKPGKEVISSLVKAVHGQAIERMGRFISNNDDLLVLSCDEDFEDCVPLLEKGLAVYSSELLLNGVITQRLEYERYRLFVANVKKTRSTLWLKKGGEQFLPVTRT
uniref:BRCT domain-containing protein n=1 Tax=Chenopodium quinoa TaxID=63459 RepID=A0A803NA45_CHEQI